MENITGRQLGQYLIIEPLGEGGMAAVYKAYQASMDRYVAVKVLPRHYAGDADFVHRFKREAKIIARLEHPNILPVHDYGESDGYTYIVMRYIAGSTLADHLQGKPLPIAQIIPMFAQVCSALDYAHSKGVIHRDVKPSNVLIDSLGNCLLSDFGISRMVEGASQLTASGAFLGTPTYASPEQALGQSLDGRSDIYSLGIMLYEMTTGQPPFEAETPMAVLVKHVHDPFPLPHTINPALSEALERVILKALAKEPEGRFQTAGELARALAAVAEAKAGPSGRTLPVTTISSAEPALATVAVDQPRLPWSRRLPRWSWIAGGLIVLSMAFGSLVAGDALLSMLKGRQATPMPTTTDPPTESALAEATEAAVLTTAPGTPATHGGTAASLAPTVPSAVVDGATPEATASTGRTWEDWIQAQSFPAPGDEPTGIVRIGDDLWINVPCSNRIYRLDLAGNLLGEVEMPKPGCGPRDVGLAWDGENFWGTWWDKAIQIDADTGQALSEFGIDSQSRSIAWDGYLLWVVDLTGNLSVYERDG